MRVLIVSKFFYPRGGAEIVAIGTKQLLEERGHQVRVFAMEYPENPVLPDSAGYAPEVSFGGGLGNKLKAFRRTLGHGDVVRAARKVLDDFRPDVVHLHNVHSYLSPVVGELAHRRGIRVVWTLHDYKLICPAYSFRRPDGAICQECLADKRAVIRHRCMKGSMAASIVGRLEARVWNRKRLADFTDLFIAPSAFMGEKMRQGGYPAEKISVICNFIDPPKLSVLSSEPVRERGDGYFCYVGRLSHEKGVDTLAEAADNAGVELRVAGDGPLLDELVEKYAANEKIRFLGKLDADGVAYLLRGAEATVIPSEWYENNPLSVIESLCAGIPVIGAEIGGIPELLSHENGRLYPSGDAESLTTLLRDFDPSAYDRSGIADVARKAFSEDTHYQRLMHAYTADD